MAGWQKTNKGREVWVDDDGEWWDAPPEDLESSAGFLERAQVGLAQDDPQSQLYAWQQIRGSDNARLNAAGEIELRNNGQWSPVEGENWTLSEMAGDIADYSGGLIEDVGAGLGAAKGALLGTAALPGVGTAAGLMTGGAGGRATASGVRQTLSNIAGVEPERKVIDRLQTIGESALQGAVEEPMALAGGKVLGIIGRNAKPALDKIGEAVKWPTKYAAGMGTVQKPSLTGDLLGQDGPKIWEKYQEGTGGFLQTAHKAAGLPNQVYDAAQKRYVAELGEDGIDLAMPADPSPIELEYLQILKDYGFSADRKLNAIGSASETDKLVNYLPTIMQDVGTAGDAFLFKRKLNDELAKSKYYSKVDSDKTNYERALVRLQKAADGVVENAAEAQGKGENYRRAKQAFSERMDILEKVKPFMRNDYAAGSFISSMENKAKRGALKDLEYLAELEPDLAPVLDEMLIASKASKLDPEIGSMDMKRSGEQVLQDIPSAAGKVVAYLATRPDVVNRGIVRAGQAGRVLNKIGEKSLAGLDTIGGQQLTRQAIRGATPEISLDGQGGRLDSQLIDFARNRYGANYKRALDSGLNERDAAYKVARDLAAKGKLKPLQDLLGMSMDKQAMIDFFGGN